MIPLLITIPHSGETVPELAQWLKNLPEPVLMRDVDRYVDQLYLPVLEKLKITYLVADCHRYVIDLNRKPDEFDADSVVGAALKAGSHPKGLHWSVTTLGERLIDQPMSMETHNVFVQQYYLPFHQQLQKQLDAFSTKDKFHLDLHSMPSQGTAMHNDPGQVRADIVVSDFHGKNARKDFVDLIIASYEIAGFKVAYNWPYFGGGITQMYGKPERGQHTVQVELNRRLYMDELSKKKSPDFKNTQERLAAAIENIHQELKNLC